MLAPGTQLGRYVVQRKLAEGGMAEIYLGSAVGPEGFSKDVVLKLVRTFLTGDPTFVQMFIAEAKLASRLNHANIVQIFDFGKHDEAYFIAMEYVEGVSLWDLRRTVKDGGEAMPVVLCAELAAQVARGLHYAHTLSDRGEALKIVHRDVTPHNVLLGHDGAVKLTDFGIAKASSSFTSPGMLKGKFAYMSPEQARGEAVDARTDVFALGIVLWELLTGGRLFEADSEVAVLRAVQESFITPPSRLRPQVPPELDVILARALARPLGERYQSAWELDRALSNFVLKHAGSAEDTSLAPYLARVLSHRGGEATRPDAPVKGPGAMPTFSMTPSSPSAASPKQQFGPTLLSPRELATPRPSTTASVPSLKTLPAPEPSAPAPTVATPSQKRLPEPPGPTPSQKRLPQPPGATPSQKRLPQPAFAPEEPEISRLPRGPQPPTQPQRPAARALSLLDAEEPDKRTDQLPGMRSALVPMPTLSDEPPPSLELVTAERTALEPRAGVTADAPALEPVTDARGAFPPKPRSGDATPLQVPAVADGATAPQGFEALQGRSRSTALAVGALMLVALVGGGVWFVAGKQAMTAAPGVTDPQVDPAPTPSVASPEAAPKPAAPQPPAENAPPPAEPGAAALQVQPSAAQVKPAGVVAQPSGPQPIDAQGKPSGAQAPPTDGQAQLAGSQAQPTGAQVQPAGAQGQATGAPGLPEKTQAPTGQALRPAAAPAPSGRVPTEAPAVERAPAKPPPVRVATGSVRLDARPYAKVTIDGNRLVYDEVQGVKLINLPAGPHTVVFTHPKRSDTQQIRVEAGRTTEAVFRLEP